MPPKLQLQAELRRTFKGLKDPMVIKQLFVLQASLLSKPQFRFSISQFISELKSLQIQGRVDIPQSNQAISVLVGVKDNSDVHFALIPELNNFLNQEMQSKVKDELALHDFMQVAQHNGFVQQNYTTQAITENIESQILEQLTRSIEVSIPMKIKQFNSSSSKLVKQKPQQQQLSGDKSLMLSACDSITNEQKQSKTVKVKKDQRLQQYDEMLRHIRIPKKLNIKEQAQLQKTKALKIDLFNRTKRIKATEIENVSVPRLRDILIDELSSESEEREFLEDDYIEILNYKVRKLNKLHLKRQILLKKFMLKQIIKMKLDTNIPRQILWAGDELQILKVHILNTRLMLEMTQMRLDLKLNQPQHQEVNKASKYIVSLQLMHMNLIKAHKLYLNEYQRFKTKKLEVQAIGPRLQFKQILETKKNTIELYLAGERAMKMSYNDESLL